MSTLVQIVYVSRSTFPPAPPERGIEPSVARILAQSRRNNARRGLVGALYFGDGCFFQCLQGEDADVDALYATLQADPRHTDLRVLSRTPIARRSFAEWSMKYVPLDEPMRALLARRGLERFDPYRFDDAAVAEVMALLHGVPGAEEPKATAASTGSARTIARAEALAGAALAVAAVALAVAIAALLR